MENNGLAPKTSRVEPSRAEPSIASGKAPYTAAHFRFLYLQVYSGFWKERPVVIKCGIEDRVKSDGAPDSVLPQEMSLFGKPTRGTSMDEFKEMLHSFLKVFFSSITS